MSLKAPTPPTPPVIDKGDAQTSQPRIDAHQFFEVPQMPFSEGTEKREQGTVDATENPVVEKPAPTRQETSPEDMAREAVANGAGALTKRTVTRADDEKISDTPPRQSESVAPIPSTVQTPPSTNSSTGNYERGQAVLREFSDEDRRVDETFTENSTPTPAPTYNHATYQESHGGLFWIVTLVFVVVATFIVAKKFLFRSKPALKKSDLFERPKENLKATAEKISNPPKSSAPAKTSKKTPPPKPAEKVPPVKPARLPKKDDDKGKHFEIRI